MTLTLTLDRVILYTVHASLIDLYLHTKLISVKLKKLFVDGQTDGHMDRHLRPTLLGRLAGVDLKISPSPRNCGLGRPPVHPPESHAPARTDAA